MTRDEARRLRIELERALRAGQDAEALAILAQLEGADQADALAAVCEPEVADRCDCDAEGCR
jgi:hypothetical protein